MDALKKAEAAKRQGADDAALASDEAATSKYGDLTLEPIGTPGESENFSTPTDTHASGGVADSPTHLPELPAHLGGLDAEFVAHHEAQKAASTTPTRLTAVAKAASASTPSASASPLAAKTKTSVADPATKADRDAARNMFDAKAAAAPARNRTFAFAIGIFTFAVTLGIVGYFWWQLQPKTGFPSGGVPIRASTPVAPQVSPVAAPAPSTASTGSAGTTTAAQGLAGQVPAAGQAALVPVPAASTPAVAPSSTPSAVQARKKQRADVAAESENDGAIRLVRVTKSPLQVNPALTKGFDNFNRGNFAAAKAEYESVVKAEPQNLEALHGLAAIAVREGRWNVADHFYERILVADPKDAAAMSAMINLHGQSNPVAAESRLKGIVSEQPESAAAQFALGNLYAGQQRWADAQQAYFKAYSADAENPDTLYNLAVSLEHMNQTKLAHQYYSLALEAAKRRPAGFDLAVAGARLAALRP